MLEKVVKKEDFRVLIAYPNYTKMLTPSSAVGLFTGILKREGYQVDLFDSTPYVHTAQTKKEITVSSGDVPNTVVLANRLLANRPFAPDFTKDVKHGMLDDWAKKVDEYKPDAIIFSTVVEDTLPQAREMLQVLSEQHANIDVLVGGVATTMMPQEVIKDPLFKLIGLGEGEETVVDFCESVRNRASLTNILSTWGRDSEDKPFYNPSRPLVDLNKNPFADYSNFDPKRFDRPLGAKHWRAMPIETFRGCVYTCTFCNSPIQKILAKERNQGDYARRKNVEILEEEIVQLMQKNDGNFLYINDDAFLARPMGEIDSFIEMYKKVNQRMGQTIPFWMQTRFEDIRDEEQLARLKEVGLYRISFGLEHGNEEYRKKKLTRNITNEKMIEKSQLVARVGIPYSVNVILGMPGETRALVFETIALNRELGGYDSIAPNVFTPYHGIKLREEAIKKGWLDPNAKTNSFVGGSLLRMPEVEGFLQEDEILRLQRCYALYVNLPKEKWPQIYEAEKRLGTNEGEALWEILRDEFYEVKYGMTEKERKPTYAG